MVDPTHDEGRMSKQDHWRQVHIVESGHSATERTGAQHRRGRGRGHSYSKYLMWDVLFSRHLPHDDATSVLEVGSAPGHLLVRYHDYFGYQPYGLDYSEEGVEINKEVFRSNGLDDSRVIHADFFAEEFHDEYHEGFDVVASHGFIEHFEDARSVVEKHLALVKPGGHLVITIPNFRGGNGLLLRLVDREQLDIHNLDIMAKDTFAGLFVQEGLETLFCGYSGTINLSMFHNHAGGWRNLFAKSLNQLQRGLNLAGFMVLRDRGLESRAFSPYLVFIGRKRPTAA